MLNEAVLGVDIGGSGMKAALVDVSTGELTTGRHRIGTPTPAAPEPMAQVFAELVDHFGYTGPIGCTFPGVVQRRSVIATAANVDERWIGVDAAALFSRDSRGSVVVMNDADAAAVAEMRVGAGQDASGTTMLITVGTGLGTALFSDGRLVPNTELGHIEIDGHDAEELATSRVRKAEGLTIDEWAGRFDRYLKRIEDLIWPDLFIIGGGISRKFDQYSSLFTCRTPIVPAMLRNEAGIVGAAMIAADSN